MIAVSEKALGEFKKVLGTEEHKGLGIKIKAFMSESSCCSCGPSQAYEMGLVEKGDDGDRKEEIGGVTFYLDEGSVELMKGCEVDFMEDHGFIVKDNNEAPSCGCGEGDYGGSCGDGGHGGSCCG